MNLCGRHSYYGGCLRGVIDEVMDNSLEESGFELHSRYYGHFRANSHGKGMNSIISQAMR